MTFIVGSDDIDAEAVGSEKEVPLEADIGVQLVLVEFAGRGYGTLDDEIF